MKIYLLWEESWYNDPDEIVGVFISEEKAKEELRMRKQENKNRYVGFTMTEHEVSE